MAEDEELEAFKQWWKRNGQSIVLGIAIAVLAVAGWEYWENQQAAARVEARQAFNSVMETLDSESAEDERIATMEYSLDNLKNNYPESPYAVFSAMIAARVYLDQDDAENAIREYEWALERAQEPPLPTVIRLRLARALFASGDYEAVLDTLGSASDTGEFAPLYRELEGDAQYALGNHEAARQAYQKARDVIDDEGSKRLLELKLSDLAAPGAS